MEEKISQEKTPEQSLKEMILNQKIRYNDENLHQLLNKVNLNHVFKDGKSFIKLCLDNKCIYLLSLILSKKKVKVTPHLIKYAVDLENSKNDVDKIIYTSMRYDLEIYYQESEKCCIIS